MPAGCWQHLHRFGRFRLSTSAHFVVWFQDPWLNGSSYVDADTMASSGTSSTVTPGAIVTADSSGTVFYVGTDQSVHRSKWGGSAFVDTVALPAGTLAEAGMDVASDSSDNIYYVASDQSIHEMWLSGSAYVDANEVQVGSVNVKSSSWSGIRPATMPVATGLVTFIKNVAPSKVCPDRDQTILP